MPWDKVLIYITAILYNKTAVHKTIRERSAGKFTARQLKSKKKQKNFRYLESRLGENVPVPEYSLISSFIYNK